MTLVTPSILLIDDHAILRSGARTLIQRHIPEVEIFEASTLSEAEQHLSGGVEADLAVLDIMLPDATGKDSLVRLRARYPSMPVIILSASEEMGEEMMDHGAAAFVPKNGESLAIVSAIRAVLAGEPYVPGVIGEELALSGTSERQRDLLKLCCEGKSNKEIGRELGISDNTVRAHLAILFRRLGVKSRADLARIFTSRV